GASCTPPLLAGGADVRWDRFRFIAAGSRCVTRPATPEALPDGYRAAPVQAICGVARVPGGTGAGRRRARVPAAVRTVAAAPAAPGTANSLDTGVRPARHGPGPTAGRTAPGRPDRGARPAGRREVTVAIRGRVRPPPVRATPLGPPRATQSDTSAAPPPWQRSLAALPG